MSKIKINVLIKTKEEEKSDVITAIYKEKEHLLIYKETDEKNTLVKFNDQEKTLERDNNELHMIYDFKKKIGTIFVKELNKTLKFPLETQKIKEEKHSISITYLVNNDKYIFQIKYES